MSIAPQSFCSKRAGAHTVSANAQCVLCFVTTHFLLQDFTLRLVYTQSIHALLNNHVMYRPSHTESSPIFNFHSYMSRLSFPRRSRWMGSATFFMQQFNQHTHTHKDTNTSAYVSYLGNQERYLAITDLMLVGWCTGAFGPITHMYSTIRGA